MQRLDGVEDDRGGSLVCDIRGSDGRSGCGNVSRHLSLPIAGAHLTEDGHGGCESLASPSPCGRTEHRHFTQPAFRVPCERAERSCTRMSVEPSVELRRNASDDVHTPGVQGGAQLITLHCSNYAACRGR